MGWWVADLFHSNPALLVSQVFWVIFSICLHELGHGWAAIRQGDSTPIHTGHMTWNPLVHMGPTSLIVFAITGLAWGAMPVDPTRFRDRYGDALVSFAGPAVNLVLTGLCIVALALWEKYAVNLDAGLRDNFRVFFAAGGMLNIALFLLNMMPVPPLDGSKILGNFAPAYRRLIEQPNAGLVGLVLLVLAMNTFGRRVFDFGARVVMGASQEIVLRLP